MQRIEKTIIELAQLFNDMEQLVTEQEPMVENIDARGEEITHNVDKAQEELGGAVEKARSRRRKKWWCLLIVRKYTPIPHARKFILGTNEIFFFFCTQYLLLYTTFFVLNLSSVFFLGLGSLSPTASCRRGINGSFSFSLGGQFLS